MNVHVLIYSGVILVLNGYFSGTGYNVAVLLNRFQNACCRSNMFLFSISLKTCKADGRNSDFVYKKSHS